MELRGNLASFTPSESIWLTSLEVRRRQAALALKIQRAQMEFALTQDETPPNLRSNINRALQDNSRLDPISSILLSSRMARFAEVCRNPGGSEQHLVHTTMDTVELRKLRLAAQIFQAAAQEDLASDATNSQQFDSPEEAAANEQYMTSNCEEVKITAGIIQTIDRSMSN